MTRPGRLIAVVCLAEVSGMAAYAAFAANLPALTASWSLTAAQAGWISGAFYAGYALSVPVLVGLTDRVPPRIIYLPAMFATAAGALGFAVLADGFWTAVICQLIMGAGLAGTYMPGLRWLTDALSGASRARAAAFFTASYALGAGLSFALLGLLASRYGWRLSLALATLGPLLAATLMALFGPPTFARPARVLAKGRIGRIFRDRVTMAYAVAYGAHNFELFGLWSWAVAFLAFTQADGVNPALLTATLTLVLLPASVLGNEVALKIGRRRWIVGVLAMSGFMACWIGFLPAAAPPLVVAGALVLYGGLAAAESGALTAAVVERADDEIRGAVMSLYSTIGFIGAFLGPIVFGMTLGWTTAPGSWGWAFLSLGLVAWIGAVVVLRARDANA
ncbi:MFS transporter [uncultured Brevundimonas sp.]|uniref:MFS transporter n=1 Tax=uncultured Brevundimonas sp. TaxID=213418 RepID=UPI0026378DAE|nr:MFS transporter [uncultured Brevundimonas sp.]